MKLDKRTIWILCGLVAGGVALNWLLNHYTLIGAAAAFIWGIMFPFVLGFIFAFLLNIPMAAIEKHVFRGRGGRLRRPLSFTLTLVLVLALLALIVLLVVPQLWETVMTLANAMPGYLAQAQKALDPYINEYLPEAQKWLDNFNVDWREMMSSLTSMLGSGAGNLFSSAVNVATGIVGGFASFFIGVVFTCYLLLDKEHLSAQLKGVLQAYVPAEKYEKLSTTAGLVGRTYRRFVTGQCIEALIVTVLYLLATSIGGFKYPLLVSVLVGVTSFIPMIGVFLGCGIGTFILLVSMGFWRALAYVILCIVLQQIENNLIYPHVVGQSVGLPPLWTLMAVMIGGGLAGIFGMLVFIPLFSVLYTLLHRSARGRLAAKGLASPVRELPAPPPRRKRPPRPRKKPPQPPAATAAAEAAETPEAGTEPPEPNKAPPPQTND